MNDFYMNERDGMYFPHSGLAMEDTKCAVMIDQLGPEGYGIFWMLIETLRCQPDYRYPFALISSLSRKFNTTQEKLKTVIASYGLFEQDGDSFFSPSLLRRMSYINSSRDKKKSISEVRHLAGIKSGEKRREKMQLAVASPSLFEDDENEQNEQNANKIEQMFNKCSTNVPNKTRTNVPNKTRTNAEQTSNKDEQNNSDSNINITDTNKNEQNANKNEHSLKKENINININNISECLNTHTLENIKKIEEQNSILFECLKYKDEHTFFFLQMVEMEIWIEQVGMNHHLDKKDVYRYLDLFIIDIRAGSVQHIDLNDCKRHFNYWLGQKLSAENNKKSKNNGSNGNTIDRRRPAEILSGLKQSDFEGTF